jgi:hypothetical protein
MAEEVAAFDPCVLKGIEVISIASCRRKLLRVRAEVTFGEPQRIDVATYLLYLIVQCRARASRSARLI